MVEEKYVITSHTKIPFLPALIDIVTGLIANAVVSRVKRTYSDIVNHLLYGRTELEDSRAPGSTLK